MLTLAIIIKKQNTNEYDQLISCYTKELGKITAIAKSILKHSSVQAMHLDVLNLVEFDLVGGSVGHRPWRGPAESGGWRMPIITGAQCAKPYLRIKSSLSSFAAASFFMEVLDKIIFVGEKDEDLWKFITETLEKLDSNSANLLSVFRNSQAELLKRLGYFPMIDRCVLCSLEMSPERDREGSQRASVSYGMRNTEGWSLSLEMGGALCRNCFLLGSRGMLLKTADWACLRRQAYLSSPDFSESPKEIRRSVLDGLFEYTFDTKFRSLDFLYQVVK